MRRAQGTWLVGLFVGAAGVGCGTINPKSTNVPIVEEFRLAPNEERFNNPPEMAYRKPAPKQEFKPGFGGPNGPGPGGGGGLSGGQAGSAGQR
jgi:hypothetical protein